LGKKAFIKQQLDKHELRQELSEQDLSMQGLIKVEQAGLELTRVE
jgi:hypothetical protein